MMSRWPVNAAKCSAGAIAHLALDRPGKSNALDEDVFREIPAVRHNIQLCVLHLAFCHP